MIYPSGPVWQRAKAEKNWLTYELIPQGPGKKPRKVPLYEGHSVAPETAAIYTFDEAMALSETIGYLPRPGSAMICIDLDGVVEGEEWVEAVLPGESTYLTYESYTEVSPSGTGLHVLLPREGWPTDSIDGGHPVGLHASGKFFFTVTLDGLEACEIQPAPRLMAAVLPGLVERLAERDAEDEGRARTTGWFDNLDPDDRVSLIIDVLEALPPEWVLDRDRWRDVTFALRGYPEAFEVWDLWSQRGGQRYDAGGNAKLWYGRERGERTIGIGSFLLWAREAGLDLGQYVRGASAERSRAALEGLAERLARVAPEILEQAAQQPSRGRLTPEELLEQGLGLIVRHEPSRRYMHLGKLSTISTSESSTLHSSSILTMYPIKMRARLEGETDADWARVPTVGQEILRRCWMTLEGPIFDPRVPFGAVYPERHGIHDYVQVNKMKLREVNPEASADPKHPALKLWAELLEQVFPIPRERDWTGLWVACKAQRPWERMVGILSVAREHGTGRGIFIQVLRRLFLHDNVEELKVEDMFGATSQWNDWMVKLLIFVNEASDDEAAGIARYATQKRKVYEQLKDMIDPGEKFVRMNIKGGKIGSVQSFTSFFICTNHEDGLPIPRGDRRVTVLDGNEERASDEWTQRMIKGLRDNEEAIAVLWQHLHEVDLAGFRPDMALETSAKTFVQEAGRYPLDEEIEGLLEALGWPVFATHGLIETLAATHSEIGRAKAREGSLSGAVERWVKANSRPLAGDPTKGGRRVRFGGRAVQTRVRVLKMGEAGARKSVVDATSTEQVIKHLEALERDTMKVKLEEAAECRALRKGMRVVK